MANVTGVSITTTAVGSLGVAQVGGVFKWAINGFTTPVPDEVTLALAAGFMIGAHVATTIIMTIARKRDAALAAALEYAALVGRAI